MNESGSLMNSCKLPSKYVGLVKLKPAHELGNLPGGLWYTTLTLAPLDGIDTDLKENIIFYSVKVCKKSVSLLERTCMPIKNVFFNADFIGSNLFGKFLQRIKFALKNILGILYMNCNIC